jgi:hypothetical protein
VAKEGKIIIDLQGGLGNQLFCYSAGYYLAKKSALILECRMTSEFNSTARDSTILSKLKLPGQFIASKKQSKVKDKLMVQIQKRVTSKISILLGLKKRNFYVSNVLGYDSNLENIQDPVHLHGYFQTWRYPMGVRQEILFSLMTEVSLSIHASELIADMKSKKSLVVHIRLGDYRNPENSYIGILSPEYYQNVMNDLNSNEYSIYVFSDDITLAKSDYKDVFPLNATWVDEKNVLSSVETLVVMSQGSAFIIANSTYSWWSAFLSNSSDFVIAPKKWFKTQEDPLDLYPHNWISKESQWLN